MLKALMVAILAAVVIVRADAKANEQTGIIISVDNATKTFICQWGGNDITYKTTDKTVFRVDSKNGSWSDVKLGVAVSLYYHVVGKDRVADRVVITTP